jgi:hypothetical protein
VRPRRMTRFPLDGRVKAPQAPRYTTISRLQSAQTLDDALSMTWLPDR